MSSKEIIKDQLKSSACLPLAVITIPLVFYTKRRWFTSIRSTP